MESGQERMVWLRGLMVQVAKYGVCGVLGTVVHQAIFYGLVSGVVPFFEPTWERTFWCYAMSSRFSWRMA